MGQQQLLLLVLATVIVGLATVAGIQAFEQGQTRANQDALTQTAVKIASDVQANLREPSQFGGAGLSELTSSSFSSGDLPSLKELGYNPSSSPENFGSGTVYSFSGGECLIGTSGTSPSAGSAASAPGSSNQIIVDCASKSNHVRVGISSLDPSGIKSAATTLGS